MEGLELIYKEHHSKRRKPGLAILKKIRGNFLRESIETGKKVLDIGCRDGALTETYLQGNTVVGADIDGEALKRAHDVYGIETVQLNLNSEWPFPTDSFDAVVAAEVLEHVYYPDKIVEKIAYVLKPQGMLVGSIPNAYSLMNRLRYLIGQKINTPLADPTHINHFSRKEFETILDHHFEQVEIIPLGKAAWLERFFPGLFSFNLLFKATNPRKIAS